MLDYRGYELIPSTKRGCKGQVETRVEQACRNCTNIKNRQTKARDASLEIIERIIEEKNLLENKILAVKLDADYAVDKNLTGLVANQIMSKYQRPVLILNERYVEKEDPFGNIFEDKTWEGSGRGYDKSSFDDLRKFLLESELVEYAQGHSNALGVGIRDTSFNEFINYSNNALKDFDFSPFYRVDFIYSAEEVTPNDILGLANFKHLWGQGVEEPLIAIENIKITKECITLMARDRNPTLKITLPNGMSLIKFRSSDEEYESLYSELGCVTLNIVGKCERNEWNGNITPQIILETYEIVGKTDYYF
jgi:single-stranded-DNA-specific exonuclease